MFYIIKQTTLLGLKTLTTMILIINGGSQLKKSPCTLYIISEYLFVLFPSTLILMKVHNFSCVVISQPNPS